MSDGGEARRSETRSWARVWAPVLMAVMFVVPLHLVMAASPYSRMFRYADAGWSMKLVPLCMVAAMVALALASRRGRPPFWLAPFAACCTAIVGLFGVWQSMGRLGDFMERPTFDPELPQRIFAEASSDSLSSAAFGALLGATILVSAGLGLAFHARACAGPAGKLPKRGLIALLGAAAFAGLWIARASLQFRHFEGAFAPLAAGSCILALVLGARALANDPQGDRRDEIVEIFSLGVASIALASLTSVVLVVMRTFRALGGESVDPSQKQRILDEIPLLIADELTLSLLSAGALALIAVVLLLPRKGAARSPVLQRAGFVAACVAIPSAAIWAQVTSFRQTLPETRPGEPGEFVVDGNIPAGTLLVDLELDEGGKGDAPANVRLSDGTTRPWTPEEPAVFEGIRRGREVSFSVVGPYRARSSGSIEMPSDKGVRVRVPALRVAPAFVSSEEWTPAERVLHIDVTDPLRYRLMWATGQLVQSISEVPRDQRALAAAVTVGWRQEGSHRASEDRKFDTAIIHHAESAGFEELQAVAAAVAETRRPVRYTSSPAFNVYVVAVHPDPRSIDSEVDPSRWPAMGEGASMDRAERARAAIDRCQGVPCTVPATRDTFGVELGRWCNRPRCSTSTLASLWTELGSALAVQGRLAESGAAFRHASMLSPALALPPNASPEEQVAWRAGHDRRIPGVRRGATTVNGRLEPKQIMAVLETREGWIRACYDDGLGRNPALQGRVALRFVIGRDGVISNVANGGSDLPDPAVVSCVVRALSGLVFTPPQGGVVTAVVPYQLSP